MRLNREELEKAGMPYEKAHVAIKEQLSSWLADVKLGCSSEVLGSGFRCFISEVSWSQRLMETPELRYKEEMNCKSVIPRNEFNKLNKHPRAVKSDKRLWLAAYEVLKSPDVYSCKLSEHRRLKLGI